MRDGWAGCAWINVLYHPYPHAKARGRSPMYSLTYNTLNMAIWRKWPKSQSTHCATSTHLSGLARAPRTPSQKPRGSARMQLGPVHARPASRHPHDASIKSFCHLLMPAGGCPCIAPQVGGVALVQRVRGDGSDCRRTASGRMSASEHSDVSRDVGHHTFTVGGLPGEVTAPKGVTCMMLPPRVANLRGPGRSPCRRPL